MSAVAPINPTVARIMDEQAKLPAVVADPWREASKKQQETAMQREELIRPVVEHVQLGVSINVAVRNLITQLETSHASPRIHLLAITLGRKGKLPGRSTLINWVNAFRKEGRLGLLDKHTGRVRKDRGWEIVAVQIFNIPSKPGYSAVAIKLREEYGFADATDSAVRRYLQSQPSTLGAESPARLGKHFHDLNRGKYMIRDISVLEVGEVYEGDGHTCDAYVSHPLSGAPYRAELTIWIDVRSHYIVGWYMSEAESSISTLFALSSALVKHDHVPAWVHIDNGSGYKSKMMCDESVGYYQRFDISTTFAIPGNSKGKGLVEGWFRYFRDHHDKFFNSGQDYCGHDQAEETNRRLSDMMKQGKRTLKSLAEYCDSVGRFIEAFNQRPQKSLDGKSPAELWATLERVPVEIPSSAVVRPRVTRKVRRLMVSLHNRKYTDDALGNYDGADLVIEYDLHDDQFVWIYDDKNRLICQARLKTKLAWMPESRLEEGREKRKKGRLKRIEQKADLVRAEEASLIDHTHTLANLEEIGGMDEPLPIEQEFTELDIDLYEEE